MDILINYADAKYERSRWWNSFTGKHIAKFDKIYEFHPDDIDTEFSQQHQDILSYKRGNGLWLWKPYFIYRVMKEWADDDIIFYCDAGAIFKRGIQPIKDILTQKNTFFVCDIPLIEENFTKPICFKKLNCDNDAIKKSNQIIATFFAFKVCNESRSFIKEWLTHCSDLELISPAGNLDVQSFMGNNFVVHREDQSLFSLLCKKHGYTPHRDISQRGKNPRSYYNPYYLYSEPQHCSDKYPDILFLHKSPKIGLYTLLKPYLREIYKKIAQR